MSALLSVAFPPFRLELQNERLWRESELIPLRPKTFAVLRYLVEHHGRLATKEQLLAAAWAGRYVEEVALAICIRELRKALGDEARMPRFIETVHGRGYRFLAPLTASQHSPRQAPKINAQHAFPAADAQHPGPPYVGREAELAQLIAWWEHSLRSERHLIFVTGEPGIGKTSLIETFLAHVRAVYPDRPIPRHPRRERTPARTLCITHGQCIEQHGPGEAFLPILDALGHPVPWLAAGSYGRPPPPLRPAMVITNAIGDPS